MFRVAFSGTERAVTRNLCFNRGNRDPAMSLATSYEMQTR